MCKNISETAQGQSVEMVKGILIVDDESDICFVLEKALGANGFMIDSYEDPLLALENFKPHSYSLLILDIKMPDLNGFALYREIPYHVCNESVKMNYVESTPISTRAAR